MLRRCVPTCTTRLYLRAAASIAWPSATSTLMGFWQYTSDARFHGLDHGERVPVIRRRDQDNVQILLAQHLAVVGIGARLLLRLLAAGDDVGRFGQHLLSTSHKRNHLDRRDLNQPQQIGLAVPARADQAHAAGLVVGERQSISIGRQGQSRGARG